MKKTNKYTALTLLLAIAFSFGSMAGMNFILQARERQLLTESGRAVVEAPIRAWEKQGSSGEMENDDNPEKEGYTLTTRQMEEALSYWKEHTGITVHNLVSGQLSMAEAMGAGEEWLVCMGLAEYVQGKEAGAVSVTATLAVAGQEVSQEVPLEPYYSFWIIRFESQTMSAVLFLNAVTGEVYDADISFYDQFPEKIPYGKLERFVELAGLQASDTGMIKDREGTQAVLRIDDSRMYAEMAFLHSQTGYSGTACTEEVNIRLKIIVEKDN